MSHVVVIGAGPAGSVAAAALRRIAPQIECTLIEQHRFPRDKVCGECLSALGIEVLTRLGLRGQVLEARPAVMTRCLLFEHDEFTPTLHLPKPMWGLTRKRLDLLLLDAARALGAEVLQPARCERIAETSDAVEITIRQIDSNALTTLRADFVLIADGKGALSDIDAPPTGDFGLKAHFTDVNLDRDVIGLFGVEGHYGGVAAVEDGLFNIAFNVPQRRIAGGARNLDSVFEVMTSENLHLRRALRSARRASSWQVAPLPRFNVAKAWRERIIPIGNAVAAIEPIGGEGMGLAMRSAELAATRVAHAISAGTSVRTNRLRSEFRKLWHRRGLACRAAATVVSSPRLSRLFAPLLCEVDALSGWALRAVGKF